MTNTRVGQIERLYDHLDWAGSELARAVAAPGAPAEAVREYAHVAGAEEVWLSRIEGRSSVAKVWPDLSGADAIALAKRNAAGYKAFIARIDDAALEGPVTYTNSANRTFSTPLGDILLHVAMHGQYHRGKVNLLLRQAGLDPVPVDFIGFVRGAPAATTPR